MNLSAKEIRPRIIALVDDEECVLEALASLLRSVGYATKEYASAESFLDSVLLEPPDCLILDLHLPGMDGLALQRRLAEQSPPFSIIFISSNGTAEQRHRALQSGAVAFISKPFGDDAILAAVRRAIRGARESGQ